jgi:hypothetical protein
MMLRRASALEKPFFAARAVCIRVARSKKLGIGFCSDIPTGR